MPYFGEIIYSLILLQFSFLSVLPNDPPSLFDVPNSPMVPAVNPLATLGGAMQTLNAINNASLLAAVQNMPTHVPPVPRALLPAGSSINTDISRRVSVSPPSAGNIMGTPLLNTSQNNSPHSPPSPNSQQLSPNMSPPHPTLSGSPPHINALNSSHDTFNNLSPRDNHQQTRSSFSTPHFITVPTATTNSSNTITSYSNNENFNHSNTRVNVIGNATVSSYLSREQIAGNSINANDDSIIQQLVQQNKRLESAMQFLTQEVRLLKNELAFVKEKAVSFHHTTNTGPYYQHTTTRRPNQQTAIYYL